MGDEYDYEAAENWGGTQYGSTDPMNLSTNDPASPYWRPAIRSEAGFDPRQLPSGTGIYDVGDGPRDIYAPGNFSPSGSSGSSGSMDFSSWRGNAPNEVTGVPTPRTSMPVGGGSGGGGFQQQPYQRISLGAPERTLYDRYKSLLENPEGMATDPAYKFLYNQGEQALKRSLAAQRLTFSGKALNDTQAYGSGMAANYMKEMLPQYRGGAQEELARYMGPAGLLPGYTGANNRASEAEGSGRAAQDLLPYYQRMMGGGGGGGEAPAIGYGGASGGYVAPRLQQTWSPPTSRSGPNSNYGYDWMSGMAEAGDPNAVFQN